MEELDVRVEVTHPEIPSAKRHLGSEEEFVLSRGTGDGDLAEVGAPGGVATGGTDGVQSLE